MDVDGFISAALAEDLGDRGDVTSDATIDASARARADIVAREAGCVAGLGIALRVFELVDDEVAVAASASDGDVVTPGTTLGSVEGPARSILAGERLALNLLGQLSGVASATKRMVDAVEGLDVAIIDTRKTVPLMRAFQKLAVVAGGGANHRMGLYDQVLIKDNHIEATGSAEAAVLRARAAVGTNLVVEVELDTLDELESVIEAGADIILLDNMSPKAMREAVERVGGRAILEASGGVTLESVRAVAESGVDRISVGALTHSAPSLDVGLDFLRSQ